MVSLKAILLLGLVLVALCVPLALGSQSLDLLSKHRKKVIVNTSWDIRRPC